MELNRTIALSNWSLYTLPQRHLEAILAHELAHHLPLPRRVSLFLYWLSMPARMMGVVLSAGHKNRAFKTLIKVVIGFFTVGVFVRDDPPSASGQVPQAGCREHQPAVPDRLGVAPGSDGGMLQQLLAQP